MSPHSSPPTPPTQMSRASGAYVFEVTDYSLHRSMDAGRFLRSAAFDAGGYDWAVRFHPGGDAIKPDSGDYVAVSFELTTMHAVVAVTYDMALVDLATGARWFATKSGKATFDTRSADGFWRWHLSRFKKRSELEASPFLRDDRLAIECTLTVTTPGGDESADDPRPTTGEQCTQYDTPRVVHENDDANKDGVSSSTPDGTSNNSSVKNIGASVAERMKQNGRRQNMPSNLTLTVLPGKRKAAAYVCPPKLQEKVNTLDDLGEKAAIQYIQTLCSSKESYGKLVYKSHRGSVMASAMRCLTIPSNVDDPAKGLPRNIIDAYTAHMKPHTKGSRLLCPVWNGTMMVDKQRVDKCSRPEHLSFYQDFARKFFDYDLILDSAWNLQQYQSTVQSLVEGIAQMTSMARIAYPSLPNDVAAWKIKEIKKVPKQTDRCSCGLYVIKYMQCWNGTKMRPYFTQEDIHILRKKMVHELIFSQSNEVAEAKEDVRKIMT